MKNIKGRQKAAFQLRIADCEFGIWDVGNARKARKAGKARKGSTAGRLFRASEPRSLRASEPQNHRGRRSEVGGQRTAFQLRIADCEFGIWDVLTFAERRAIRKILNLPYALCPMPHAELSWLLTTGSSSLYDFYDLNDLNDLNRSLLTAYCLLITW